MSSANIMTILWWNDVLLFNLILLFPKLWLTVKILTWVAAKNFFFINLIKFFKAILHLKTTLTALFFVEKQKNLSFIVWRTKCKFVRINLLVEIFFVCVFSWNKKYVLYTFDLCGRVGDKKNFTRPISGNKTTFFGLTFLSTML